MFSSKVPFHVGIESGPQSNRGFLGVHIHHSHGWRSSRLVSVLDSGAERPGFIAATLSGNSLGQTVHTHRASVYQAAKLVVALLSVLRVTAGLAESIGSVPPGTGISCGAARSVIEYELSLLFTCTNAWMCLYHIIITAPQLFRVFSSVEFARWQAVSQSVVGCNDSKSRTWAKSAAYDCFAFHLLLFKSGAGVKKAMTRNHDTSIQSDNNIK